jgi:hypothetical protein
VVGLIGVSLSGQTPAPETLVSTRPAHSLEPSP